MSYQRLTAGRLMDRRRFRCRTAGTSRNAAFSGEHERALLPGHLGASSLSWSRLSGLPAPGLSHLPLRRANV
jgi:hypothetical protein